MKDLIILGTGVHGAEMAEIVARVNAAQPTWRLIGHIAAKSPPTTSAFHGNPVLGTLDALKDYPEACLVPENEFPRNLLAMPRERFISLVDPTCFISRSARIGPGCVFYPGCYVGLNAKVGEFVFALAGCTINHDDVIGDRVILAAGATLAGSVHVEADCYMGQSCSVRQLLRIGKGSLIGMGSVVVKDVPPNSVMIGNPARKLRDKVAPGSRPNRASGECAKAP